MANPDLKFDTNTELSSRRTGMSFQRTRMSADRTLMSVIRTSLSLIGFGFAYHVQFMMGLRRLRESMREEGLVHGETVFPLSFTLVTALVLLLIGVAAIMSMVFHVGPFE